MVDSQKTRKAIKVIQNILIEGRAMAYRGDQLGQIAKLLDHGEYLPGLILDPDDKTSIFEQYLAGIVRDFPDMQWILDEYQQ